jgi:hypothetical protein
MPSLYLYVKKIIEVSTKLIKVSIDIHINKYEANL